MNRTEIDLLDFIKKIVLSYKMISFITLISLVISYASFKSKNELILDTRIHDSNGIFDARSVDYIKHLLIINSKFFKNTEDYVDIILSVHPSSDAISTTYQIRAETTNKEIVQSFARNVMELTNKNYIQYYQEKNRWVEKYDEDVKGKRVQKYEFTNINEYRNYIFWKKYSGQDAFQIEYVSISRASNSLQKRMFYGFIFGLFLGIAISIVRIAINKS